MTQVSQARGQLWGGTTTEVNQLYSNPSYPSETHAGAVYWVVGTASFGSTGHFTLTDQGYVSAAHEELEFRHWRRKALLPRTAATVGIRSFTLIGSGGRRWTAGVLPE